MAQFRAHDYETMEEYNEEAGEVAEPYRLLVVANFPVKFTETAARRLESIASNGPRNAVFDAPVYGWQQPAELRTVVPLNQELFAGSDDPWTPRAGDTPERRRQVYERYLELLPEDAGESVSALLQRLFTKYASAFGGSRYGPEWNAEWRKQLRICSSDIFPRYFRLSLEEGAISNAKMRAFLSLASDPGTLTQEIIRLANEPGPDGRISRAREFLERVQDYTREDIPIESIEPILQLRPPRYLWLCIKWPCSGKSTVSLGWRNPDGRRGNGQLTVNTLLNWNRLHCKG
ncbi:MAG: hypothetical protein ACUVV0_14380 [Anaerolineae bacterium]